MYLFSIYGHSTISRKCANLLIIPRLEVEFLLQVLRMISVIAGVKEAFIKMIPQVILIPNSLMTIAAMKNTGNAVIARVNL